MHLEVSPPVEQAELEALSIALVRAGTRPDSRAYASASAWQRAGRVEAVGFEAVERLEDVGSPTEPGRESTRARL